MKPAHDVQEQLPDLKNNNNKNEASTGSVRETPQLKMKAARGV